MLAREVPQLTYVRAVRYARPSPELDVVRDTLWNIADETFGREELVSSSYIYRPQEIGATLFERRIGKDSELTPRFSQFAERMGRRRLPGGRRIRTAWGKVERAGRDNPLPDQLKEQAAVARRLGNSVLNFTGVRLLEETAIPGFLEYALIAESGPAVDVLSAQRQLIIDKAIKLRNLNVVARLDDTCQPPVDQLPFARVPEATGLQHEEFVDRVEIVVQLLQLELEGVKWSVGQLS